MTKNMASLCPATSSKARWVRVYTIGVTILGKLKCPNKKKKFVFTKCLPFVKSSAVALLVDQSTSDPKFKGSNQGEKGKKTCISVCCVCVSVCVCFVCVCV